MKNEYEMNSDMDYDHRVVVRNIKLIIYLKFGAKNISSWIIFEV